MRKGSQPSSKRMFRPDGSPIPGRAAPQQMQPMERPVSQGLPPQNPPQFNPPQFNPANRPMPVQSNSIWNRQPQEQPQGEPMRPLQGGFQGLPQQMGGETMQLPQLSGIMTGQVRPQQSNPQQQQEMFAQAINKVKGGWQR